HSTCQISSDTSPAERPCTRIWVGVTTCTSATAGSVTETRFRRSLVLISSDFPTMTRRGAAPVASEGAGTEAVAGCSGCWVASCWRNSAVVYADSTSMTATAPTAAWGSAIFRLFSTRSGGRNLLIRDLFIPSERLFDLGTWFRRLCCRE